MDQTSARYTSKCQPKMLATTIFLCMSAVGAWFGQWMLEDSPHCASFLYQSEATIINSRTATNTRMYRRRWTGLVRWWERWTNPGARPLVGSGEYDDIDRPHSEATKPIVKFANSHSILTRSLRSKLLAPREDQHAAAELAIL